MKLRNLVGGLALVAFAFTFTSCKKDWTCVCTVDGVTLPGVTIADKTKSDAKDACEKDNSAIIDCKLK